MSISVAHRLPGFQTLRELSAFEKRALVLAGLCCSVLLWMITCDVYIFGRFTEEHRHKALASLESLSSDVKRRPATIPVWQRADNAQSFYPKDQVFTGAGSKATLFFPAMNARLDLEENTLIVIDQNDKEESKQSWLSGVFGKQAASESTGVSLNVNGSKAKLSQDAVVSVRKGDDGKLALNVYSGNVSIVDDTGTAKDIEANQRVALNADGAVQAVEVIPFTLSSPENNALLRNTSSLSMAVHFQWNANKAKDQPLTIQIAADASFQNSLVDYPVPGGVTNQNLDISEGEYYWRLKSPSGEYSEARHFRVESFGAPKLLNPVDQEMIQVTDEARTSYNINLNWSAQALANKYEVQVAQDRSFATIDYTTTTTATAANPDVGLDKTFYWRVRAIDEKSTPSAWSEIRVLSTKRTIVLPLVTGMTAKAAKLTLAEAESTEVALSWNEVTRANTYEVEFLRSQSENDADPFIVTTKVNEAHHTMTVQEPGRYRWRVRALRGDLQSVTSPFNTITINAELKIPAPQVSSASKSRVVEYDLNTPSINWSWASESKDATFEVEVAKASDFSDVLSKNTTSLKTFAVPLSQGDYYFHVRTIASGVMSPWSDTQHVSVQKVVVPEALLLASVTPAKTVFFNQTSPTFKVTWQTSEQASSYQIDVARATPVASSLEASSSATYEFKATESSTLRLRARAKDRSARMGYWSEPITLTAVKTTDIPIAVSPQNLANVTISETGELSLTWAFSRPGFDHFSVRLSTNADMSGGKEFDAKARNTLNLKGSDITPGKKYWQVIAMNNEGGMAIGDIQTFTALETAQVLSVAAIPYKRWLADISSGFGYMSYKKFGPTNDYSSSDFTSRILATLKFQINRNIGVFAEAQMLTAEYFYEESQSNDNQKTSRVYEPSYYVGGVYQAFFSARTHAGIALLVGESELQNITLKADQKTLSTSNIKHKEALAELSGGIGITTALRLATALRVSLYEKAENYSLRHGEHMRLTLGLDYTYTQSRLGFSLQHEKTQLELNEGVQQGSTNINVEDNSILLHYGLDL